MYLSSQTELFQSSIADASSQSDPINSPIGNSTVVLSESLAKESVYDRIGASESLTFSDSIMGTLVLKKSSRFQHRVFDDAYYRVCVEKKREVLWHATDILIKGIATYTPILVRGISQSILVCK